MENSLDMIKSGWFLLKSPFTFWYLFIIGKNPIKEIF